jgi:hypothetical protein
MTNPLSAEPKAVLQRYLNRNREALLWKLDGLSEYDVRRPMTPTGTNLLGIVKHLAAIEAGYFGDTFGRPLPDQPAYFAEMDDSSEPNLDMWATPAESTADLTALYRRVCAHSDETITAVDLDGEGSVPWWGAGGPVTLHWILVHMIDETARHCGHADIVRELIDSAAGVRQGVSNLPSEDPQWWADYRAKVQAAADRFND